MTTGPRRVVPNDEDLFGGAVVPPSAIAQQELPTRSDLIKAEVVLSALVAAGLRTKYEFDPGSPDVVALWAARLKPYPVAVLTEAIRDWTSQADDDFPSLGEVETCAQFVVAEQLRAERLEEVAAHGACRTCDGNRYVRVYADGLMLDPDVPAGAHSHMAPCPDPSHTDMVKRRDLWDRGHWLPEHVDGGGCPACWEYHPSLAHRARAQRKKAS